VKEAACPVILLLHAPDPPFVREASKRGIFAYITDSDVEEWQSAMEAALRHGALGWRRAVGVAAQERRTTCGGFSGRCRLNGPTAA
jgi:hypothetical protein